MAALGGGRYPGLRMNDVKAGRQKISMGTDKRGEAYLFVYNKEKDGYWSAS